MRNQLSANSVIPIGRRRSSPSTHSYGRTWELVALFYLHIKTRHKSVCVADSRRAYLRRPVIAARESMRAIGRQSHDSTLHATHRFFLFSSFLFTFCLPNKSLHFFLCDPVSLLGQLAVCKPLEVCTVTLRPASESS